MIIVGQWKNYSKLFLFPVILRSNDHAGAGTASSRGRGCPRNPGHHRSRPRNGGQPAFRYNWLTPNSARKDKSRGCEAAKEKVPTWNFKLINEFALTKGGLIACLQWVCVIFTLNIFSLALFRELQFPFNCLELVDMTNLNWHKIQNSHCQVKKTRTFCLFLKPVRCKLTRKLFTLSIGNNPKHFVEAQELEMVKMIERL